MVLLILDISVENYGKREIVYEVEVSGNFLVDFKIVTAARLFQDMFIYMVVYGLM